MINPFGSADGFGGYEPERAGGPNGRLMSDVTRALVKMRSGRPEDANRFWSLVDGPLRKIARRLIGQRARSGGMIQTTAVLNEAYLRLVDRSAVDWRDGAHFYAAAGKTIRRSLIDWIRREGRVKRGGDHVHVTLELAGDIALRQGLSPLDVLALDEALNELATKDPRSAAVVELRYFGGLSVKEVGAVLGIADRTIDKDWHYARSWLHRRLSK